MPVLSSQQGAPKIVIVIVLVVLAGAGWIVFSVLGGNGSSTVIGSDDPRNVPPANEPEANEPAIDPLPANQDPVTPPPDNVDNAVVNNGNAVHVPTNEDRFGNYPNPFEPRPRRFPDGSESIHGYVKLDAEGQPPLAGVKVAVDFAYSMEGQPEHRYRYWTVTQGDGQWTMTRVFPEVTVTAMTATPEGGAAVPVGNPPFAITGSKQHDILLSPSAAGGGGENALTVEVLTDNGAGRSGARVTLNFNRFHVVHQENLDTGERDLFERRSSRSRYSGRLPAVETDEGGLCKLNWPGVEDYRLDIEIPDGPSLQLRADQLESELRGLQVEWVARGDNPHLQIRLPGALQGEVVDGLGQPVANQTLQLEDEWGNNERVDTDGNGRFTTMSISADSEISVTEVDRRGSSWVGHFMPERGWLHVTLTGMGALRVAAARLQPAHDMRLVLREGDMRPVRNGQAISAIYAGTYDNVWVLARGEWPPSGPFSVTVREGEIAELVFDPAVEAAAVTGRVLRSDGVPTASIIHVIDPSGTIPPEALPIKRLGNSGAFRLENLPPVPLRLVIGFRENNFAAGAAQIDVELAPGKEVDLGGIRLQPSVRPVDVPDRPTDIWRRDRGDRDDDNDRRNPFR